jgi:hypothetical protein
MGTAPHTRASTAGPQLFLLRVWLERGGFRAALREIGGAEPRVFNAPQELGEFLSRSLVSPPTEDDDRSTR